MRRIFRNAGSAQNQDALVAQDLDTASEEEDFEAWAAYRKARKAKRESVGGGSRRSTPGSGKGKVKNAANRRTGETSRSFVRNSECHNAPQCPRKGSKSGGISPRAQGNTRPQSKPYSSIALESPVDGYGVCQLGPSGSAQVDEHSLSTTMDLGGEFFGVKGLERGGPGYGSHGKFGAPRVVREPQFCFGSQWDGEGWIVSVRGPL